MFRKLLLLLPFFLVVQLSAQPWKPIGEGFDLLKTQGSNVVITFGGWTVKQEWANHWTHELYKAKLHENNTGFLFSVRGPKEVAFESLEIDTRTLSAMVYQLVDSILRVGEEPEVTLIAHSSGAYVAHNFLTHLLLNRQFLNVVDNRITYYCLDGGVGTTVFGTTMTQQLAQRLKKIVAVYAYDPTSGMQSPNAFRMLDMAKQFPEKTVLRTITTSSSGCTGKWCLHEVLINKRPHNPGHYDLKNDYGSIGTSHPVCWEYLK